MKNLEDVLFIDIETVPQYPKYEGLDERWQQLWDRKARFIAHDQEPGDVYNRAGIYAEFGKVICISAAFIVKDNDQYNLRIKSFYGHDEKSLLSDFSSLLEEKYKGNSKFLCAHNGKEFDYPYLCRRILSHHMPVPDILDLSGKKPWEVRHFDTLHLWKFGDYKNYTSLDLLAAVFDIPTPKSEMDGSMVYETYYKDQDLEKIKNYCQKDVITLTNIFLRMKNHPIILEDNITVVV